jgi:hypothetical protein
MLCKCNKKLSIFVMAIKLIQYQYGKIVGQDHGLVQFNFGGVKYGLLMIRRQTQG